MDVSGRGLHVQLTQEAKIASDFSLIRAIFAFADFGSALAAMEAVCAPLPSPFSPWGGKFRPFPERRPLSAFFRRSTPFA